MPIPTEEDKTKYNGVSIKNFPKETKQAEIVEFLLSRSLPDDFSEDKVEVGSHGNVEITKISSETCQEIISKVHFAETRQKFFGRPIYCRAIRELTPVKAAPDNPNGQKSDGEKVAETRAKGLVNDPNLDITPEDDEFGGGKKDGITDDFVFDPPVAKLKSKLFKNAGDTTEEDTDNETPNPAEKFLKESKTPAMKTSKRSRATPGTSETKVGKKTKTKSN